MSPPRVVLLVVSVSVVVYHFDQCNLIHLATLLVTRDEHVVRYIGIDARAIGTFSLGSSD